MKAMYKYKTNTLRCRRALASLLLFFLLFTELGTTVFAAEPGDIEVIYEEDTPLPEDAVTYKAEPSEAPLPYEADLSASEDTLPYEAQLSPSENSSPSEEDASISENSPAAEAAPVNALEANAILRSESAEFCERYGIDTDLVSYGNLDALTIDAATGYTGDNAQAIFRFLCVELGLHNAASVGILTNIYCESGFRPDALGDNGTSYGICQWHLGRWDRLKNWCNENGLNWESLDGQLKYLQYEAELYYPATMNAIRTTTENNADGAWRSAYLWCKNFEVPANTIPTSEKRGDLAVEVFWPLYKDYGYEVISPAPDVIDDKEDRDGEERNQIQDGDLPEGEEIPEGIWFAGLKNTVYNGSAQKQSFRVYDHKTLLKEGTDYKVSYKYNKNAGGDPSVSADAAADRSRWPQLIITMKGNYSGKYILPFVIEPADLSAAELSLPVTVYNGKAQKPKPVLILNGKKLKYGKDFTVPSYTDPAAGDWRGSEKGQTVYPLRIVGCGNYRGEIESELCIVGTRSASENSLPQVLLSKVKAAAIPAQQYRGEEYRIVSMNETGLYDKNGNPLSLQLKYKGKLLSDNDVEVVSVENALLPGTATIRLRGKNAAESATGYSFTGDLLLSFTIKGLALKNLRIEGLQKSYDWTGEEIRPEIRLSGIDGFTEEDYEISYLDNIEPGTATLIISGRRAYTGCKKTTFRINGIPVEGEDFCVMDTDAVPLDEKGEAMAVLYEKKGAAPPVRLYYKGTKLLPGRDYTLEYKNNNKAADWDSKNAPTILVKGKGRYAGTRTLHYSITLRPFGPYIRVFAADLRESAEPGHFTQKIRVSDTDGSKLTEGQDYSAPKYYLKTENGIRSLLPGDRPVAGDVVYAAITGMGGYRKDTVYCSFRIIKKKQDISKASFKIADQNYKYGLPVYVSYAEAFTKAAGSDKKALVYGKDFEVVPGSYVGNTASGTAKVTIRGLGDYGGKKVVSFRILKKRVET